MRCMPKRRLTFGVNGVAAIRQHLKSVCGRRGALKDADALVEKSIWLIGGDGWAYDIALAV